MRHDEKTKDAIFIEKTTIQRNCRSATDCGKSVMIAVIFMCIILLGTGFFSYTFGYSSASQDSYKQGYTEGSVAGNSTGYELGYSTGDKKGYDRGYESGNKTGYTIGYKTGFDHGSSEGYTTGFEQGKTTGFSAGYEEGYSAGFTNGNASGYNVGYSLGYNNGFTQGNSTGYIDGFNLGYLQGVSDCAGRCFNIRDPTYQEMINFISQDPTDKNAYVPEVYECHHFTADVKNNAFKIGYRCGYVYIRFPDSAHAIVCFNTTDRGLIFIEPQDDRIISLNVGQPYWNRTKYLAPSYNDTIVYYNIIW